MFSATMAPSIIKTAQNYLQNPVRVSVGSTTAPTDRIKQEVIKTTDSEKYNILMDQLNKTEGSFIIFMKTKHATERLALKLRGSGHTADAIHGDLRQRNREQVIRGFRAGKHRILVATDVAARGLDIPHIECVVNYDLPMNPEDYIHRIGRTGRAGKEGVAISLVTPIDGSKWRAIHKLINDGEHTAPEVQRRAGSAPRRNDDRKKDFSRSSGPKRFESDSKKKDFGSNAGGASWKKDFGDAPKRFEGEGKKRSFGGNTSGNTGGDSWKKDFGDEPKRFEGEGKKRSFGAPSEKRFEGDRKKKDFGGNKFSKPGENRGNTNFRAGDKKRSGPRPTRAA
jgi:ATP-dependent RNA helicase DeaD